MNQNYKDCKSKEEKIRWLQSPKGQQVLSQRPRLQQLYQNGKLFAMIDHPEWSEKLNTWLSIESKTGFLNNIFNRFQSHTSNNTNIPMNPIMQMISNAKKGKVIQLSLELKIQIKTHGYTILPQLIPNTILIKAIKHINYKIGQRFQSINTNTSNQENIQNFGDLTSIMSNDINIMALYYETSLCSFVNSLLHGIHRNNLEDLPIVLNGQIALRFPELEDIPTSNTGTLLGGYRWHIDGMDKGPENHSPFTLLVGVALSDQLQSFCGNFCVFPGSHILLQQQVKDYITKKNMTASSWHESSTNGKLNLGEPIQVKLHAGDVVIAIHKLAHRGGPNYSFDIRKMVYFRIQHKNHSQLISHALDNLWIEFEGLSD